jgi:hypothetical protein
MSDDELYCNCDGMKRHNANANQSGCVPCIEFSAETSEFDWSKGMKVALIPHFFLAGCDDENHEPIIYCPYCGTKLVMPVNIEGVE